MSFQNQLWLLSWLLHPLWGAPLSPAGADHSWWPQCCLAGGWAPGHHSAAHWLRVWSAEHIKCGHILSNLLKRYRLFQILCAPSEEDNIHQGIEFATTATRARVRLTHYLLSRFWPFETFFSCYQEPRHDTSCMQVTCTEDVCMVDEDLLDKISK